VSGTVDGDAREVRRAALTVGRRVTLLSCVLVAVVVGLAVAYILTRSKTAADLVGQRIYIDSVDLLFGVAALGVVTILLAGVASWSIARGAVRPLGAALRLQRTFVADASHELRTPLAVLDARVQLLQRRLPAEGEVASEIAAIRADTRALSALVTDLLEIADADGRAAVSPGVPDVDAGLVTRDVAQAMRAVADERGIRIDVEDETAAPVAVPAASLRRCLVALVDNALGHTPDGRAVDVRVTVPGRTVVIEVADRGTGIRGIESSRVFDRFARADPDPDAPLPPRRGFGIGLALVRDVVVRHGGTVGVATTSSTGTTMRIELPQATR
jgi:two-component system, OmpR family, sensor kinase